MKRALALVLGALTVLLAVVAVRTARLQPAPPPADADPAEADAARPSAPDVAERDAAPEREGAIERLARALTFRTVSRLDRERVERAFAGAEPWRTDALGPDAARPDAAPPEASEPLPVEFEEEEFAAFHAFLRGAFPRVHESLARESPDGRALLFTWPGRRPELAPAVLMAHMDVVPVEPDTEDKWTYPPFGGRVADGYVWGRGALDDKAGLMAILEATEALLAEGWQPDRTFLLAFGGDEEVGGTRGAARIAARLTLEGVRPAVVVDEGGFLVEGLLEGVRAPVALLGIGEKGYANIRLTVRGAGGHASVPPREPAAAVLGRALDRLARHPMPTRLEPAAPTFEAMAPEMGLLARALVANRWLTAPLIRWRLSRQPTTDALIRTTIAPTLLEGSGKENVLPARARALLNVRVLPGDSVRDVVVHVRRVVDDDRVEVTLIGGPFAIEPPPVSPDSGAAYEALRRAVAASFPEAIPVPYLLFAATDSRWFAPLTPHIYRFRHLRLEPGDAARIHGTDERIAVQDHLRGIGFWRRLIRTIDAMEATR